MPEDKPPNDVSACHCGSASPEPMVLNLARDNLLCPPILLNLPATNRFVSLTTREYTISELRLILASQFLSAASPLCVTNLARFVRFNPPTFWKLPPTKIFVPLTATACTVPLVSG